MDTAIDMDGVLINAERKEFVQVILKEMPTIEARILQLVFVEDIDRDEICRQMNVRRDYLRVILHRALARFKKLAGGTSTAAGS